MEYSKSDAGMNTITPIQYPIKISTLIEGGFLNELISVGNYSQLFVLVDSITEIECYPKIKNIIPAHTLISIATGEQHKHIDTCKEIWDVLAINNADRNAVLINLGGGVIGDMGGFAASTFKRGIAFIQMPTTLLSQVDASVGGKLGVDYNSVKNIIGVFNNPIAVLIATDFLNTLPERQLTNGFAEVIKHGLIADKEYWEKISQENPTEIKDWVAIIQTSVNIKKHVVETDYKETGLRKTLNFGHTIGHAVETWSMQQDADPLFHGEAIAIGMICEAFLSHLYLELHAKELAAITNSILQYFPGYNVKDLDTATLISFMMQDKKNCGDSIRFSLLNHIGDCNYDIAVKQNDILEALQFYSSQS
ncbi:MAG: 3-dehydroquinate synthase [Chitinophagales bacterium]|nr:3-dehydroquinate synthase [Chitinophagales bacterium]MBP8754333.1 3-dehydroquinate synthase [Chitinophagales bacterium]MBP9190345.1 3-dehydroquinate synthase [Chitinophagales bacterium]MBP9549621.1 3-dehydroquinate synthase [Chitinophagales bacterium]MBP9705158.1 3-dehydroquinate synthase [Chitinophagales bacterium]